MAPALSAVSHIEPGEVKVCFSLVGLDAERGLKLLHSSGAIAFFEQQCAQSSTAGG
jgi:hypothetical protein